MRVVSLLPAAAETVALLGAADMLVGLGHEDDFPPAIVNADPPLPRLTFARIALDNMDSEQIDQCVSEARKNSTALYAVDATKLAELKPDVILTQGLCPVCAVSLDEVEAIVEKMSMSPRPAICAMTPNSLGDVLVDITKVADALQIPEKGAQKVSELKLRIENALKYVPKDIPECERPKVAFLEWIEPIFTAGHWTAEMLVKAGGKYDLNPPGQGPDQSNWPSIQISKEKFIEFDPDIIIVCPCGFDLPTTKKEMRNFLRESDWWTSLRAVKAGKVALADGSAMFNRPGPRLVDALEWLVSILHQVDSLWPANFPGEWYSAEEEQ